MKHIWTQEETDRLEAAVRDCEHLRGIIPIRETWWAMVAGRAGLEVTPDAARTRWQKTRRTERERTDESWRDASTRAEAFEQDKLDYMQQAIDDIKEELAEMRANISALLRIWR